MTKEEKALIMGKRIEAGLALFLLIPPVLGVIAFVLCLFGCEWNFAGLSDLSNHWTGSYGYDRGGGGYTSAAPIYLGLMAIAGVWLLKDSFKYWFMEIDEDSQKKNRNLMPPNVYR